MPTPNPSPWNASSANSAPSSGGEDRRGSLGFYRGNGADPAAARPLPSGALRWNHLRRPEAYLAPPGLVDACNVALLLGQPLLLTGEPGTGKTQFAYSLAHELGLGEPLKFETKSTSASRELFYTYDALRRFHDSHNGRAAVSALPYITYGALGAAIIRSRDPATLTGLLPEGFDHGGRRRSVVLIDEVDKAPRDFPNDLLNEVEQLYFRIGRVNK